MSTPHTVLHVVRGKSEESAEHPFEGQSRLVLTFANVFRNGAESVWTSRLIVSREVFDSFMIGDRVKLDLTFSGIDPLPSIPSEVLHA